MFNPKTALASGKPVQLLLSEFEHCRANRTEPWLGVLGFGFEELHISPSRTDNLLQFTVLISLPHTW